ncbi:hypothetical protein [Bacillus piscicola]|uniref:hypothetical protein n=1 Tax=Bacillus piscicola TaxID=1632684 RepID=UPI001F0898D4|nr:hypothetical protein [Bacillus piscicola]
MKQKKDFLIFKTELRDSFDFHLHEFVGFIPNQYNSTYAHLEIRKFLREKGNFEEGKYWLINKDDILDYTDGRLTLNEYADVSYSYHATERINQEENDPFDDNTYDI